MHLPFELINTAHVVGAYDEFPFLAAVAYQGANVNRG